MQPYLNIYKSFAINPTLWAVIKRRCERSDRQAAHQKTQTRHQKTWNKCLIKRRESAVGGDTSLGWAEGGEPSTHLSDLHTISFKFHNQSPSPLSHTTWIWWYIHKWSFGCKYIIYWTRFTLSRHSFSWINTYSEFPSHALGMGWYSIWLEDASMDDTTTQ